MRSDVVRTQVQLTEEQAAELRRLSAQQQRSMADLIREALDDLLMRQDTSARQDRMRRATRAFGRFRSATGDLSRRHDALFAGGVAKR
jgi:Arc/MetJ-type ribon-helix-helix transcriptional regulator